MERKVQIYEYGQVVAEDLNNLQSYAGDAIDHVVADAVTDAVAYTGFNAVQSSATAVTVGAGRFYHSGLVYVSESPVSVELIGRLPLSTSRLVAIVVWGGEVETDVTVRDYVIDVNTRATEPQAKPITKLRLATVDVSTGVESVDPQMPSLPANAVAVAVVRLSTTGIESVTSITESALPSLKDHAGRVQALETWRGKIGVQVDALATDLAGLTERTASLAGRAQLMDLIHDVTRLKQQAGLPDAWVSYGADNFHDATETDEAGVGYAAQIEDGLKFPHAASAAAALALFNPLDTKVAVSNNVLLPAYTTTFRAGVSGVETGAYSLAWGYSANLVTKNLAAALQRIWHGWGPHRSLRWYLAHDAAAYGLASTYRLLDAAVRRVRYGYVQNPAAIGVTGATSAEVLLVPNAMWLAEVGVYCGRVGAGPLTVLVCETKDGEPDLSRVLTSVTVDAADLRQIAGAQSRPSEESRIPVPPVLLEGGKRYATCFVTSADHRLQKVSGTAYPQGIAYRTTDGVSWEAMPELDIVVNLYGTVFPTARTEVQLQPVSLAGGIQSIKAAFQAVIPDGCALWLEGQIGGVWKRLDGDLPALTGAPDLVPLRAVLIGTGDLAPSLTLAADAVEVAKFAEAMVHWSTERTLAVASDAIQVQVLAAGYDGDVHSVTAELVDGATTYAAASSSVEDDPDGKRLLFNFTPNAPAGITTFKIKLTGTRTTPAAPFAILERVDVAS